MHSLDPSGLIHGTEATTQHGSQSPVYKGGRKELWQQESVTAGLWTTLPAAFWC